MINEDEIIIRIVRTGVIISWLGRFGKLTGGMVDGFGGFDDCLIGQPLTGRIGVFPFKVLDYDFKSDVFSVEKINE